MVGIGRGDLIVFRRRQAHQANMQLSVFRAFFLLAASLLAACGDQKSESDGLQNVGVDGTYSDGCNTPLKPFKTESDGIDHHAIVWWLQASSEDEMRLDSEPVTIEGLLQRLHKAGEIIPPPYVILEFAPDTPCGFVNDLRSNLGETRLCREGACAEGTNWRSWPVRMGSQADKSQSPSARPGYPHKHPLDSARE